MSIHPPFTALRSVQTVLEADDIPIALGAQDVFWEPSGAYTGEISPLMLAKLNVSYVIVGHSERRQYFGETDETVNKKVAAVLGAGMTPIMCVGETPRGARGGRDRGQGPATSCGADWPASSAEAVGGLVVAYEPIWAIGTGPHGDAGGRPGGVRRRCGARWRSSFGAGAAAAVRIQYGGSVQAGQHRGAHGPTGHRRGPGRRRQPRPGRIRANCRPCQLDAGGPGLEQL